MVKYCILDKKSVGSEGMVCIKCSGLNTIHAVQLLLPDFTTRIPLMKLARFPDLFVCARVLFILTPAVENQYDWTLMFMDDHWRTFNGLSYIYEYIRIEW